MKEKERRIKQKREQTLFEQEMQTIHHHQELVHMPPPSPPFAVSTSSNCHSQICPENDNVKI